MIRYYKGKYPCVILHIGYPKVLVMWLCNCKVVGNARLGYKEVNCFDIDIINYMRLLYLKKQRDKEKK